MLWAGLLHVWRIYASSVGDVMCHGQLYICGGKIEQGCDVVDGTN